MMMVLSDTEYAELVVAVLNHDDEAKPYPRYSGRGMYNQHCFGYVTENPALIQLELARIHLKRMIVSDQCDSFLDSSVDNVFDEIAYAVADDIGAPTSDSMGRGTIYYWRGITVADDAATEDDEQ